MHIITPWLIIVKGDSVSDSDSSAIRQGFILKLVHTIAKYKLSMYWIWAGLSPCVRASSTYTPSTGIYLIQLSHRSGKTVSITTTTLLNNPPYTNILSTASPYSNPTTATTTVAIIVLIMKNIKNLNIESQKIIRMQTYFLNLEHKLHSLIESSPTFSANSSRQEKIIQQPSHSRYVSQQNMLDCGVICIDMIEDESTLVYGFASCAGQRKWVVGLVYFSKHDGAYRMKQVATFPWKVTCCRFVRSINCQCFVVGGEHGHVVRLTFQHRDRVQYKVMRVSVWSVVELKPLYVKGKKPYLLVVTLDELIVVVDVEEWALRQKFVPVMLQMLRSAEHALINNITILTHPAHPIYLIQGCHYGTIRVWQLPPSSLSSPSPSSNQSQQSVQIISGPSTKQTQQTQRKKVKITLFPKTIINSIYPEGLIWIQLYGLLLVAITKQYQLVFTALQIKGEIVSESYEHLVRYPLLQLPCTITDVKCFPQYSTILYSVHTSTGLSSVYVLTLNQYYKPDRQVRIKSKNLDYVRGMLISQSGQFLLMHNTSQIMISFEEGLLAPPRVY